MSILFLMDGRIHLAASLILLAVVADCLDGLLARKKGSSSQFGMELDSLADLVSFGVAPGALLYTMFSNPLLAVFSAIIPACGALRLARFNVSEFKGGFTGLPIPASGGFIASLAFWSPDFDPLFLLPVTIVLSALMVSEVKYFKYQSKTGKKPVLVYLLVASFVPAVIDKKFILLPFLVYIVSGLLKKFG
jgi:CDP-diacylglycerol--serine O-phosphatidyltransferase